MAVFFYICEYFEISPKEFFDGETTNPELINRFIIVLKKLEEPTIIQLLGITEKLAGY